MMLKNNFGIHWSGYKWYMSSLVQSAFLIVFTMALNKQKEFETSKEPIN